ncbi:hypothetical protein AJ79_08363 [Helicocarpus griseus UAMH5409]|uniref:Aminoglycoside phosphotransferase domain-containing protein n=1 Tax=Helicocarpus griseus UAMH5409 TaxID=1447875 RepID=A0A2B7WTP1_9EURO|nr:hypothetical protein AJ79_08363 [Helicocarpus griseus UAMH5409]
MDDEPWNERRIYNSTDRGLNYNLPGHDIMIPILRKRPTRVVFESDSTVRKYGSPLRIQKEAEAIAFVRKHTCIPVPEIKEYEVSENGGWFLMTRSAGSQLDICWPKMTEDARAETAVQLQSYITQLRNLQPPKPGWIGSCTGGSAYDHRLNNGFPCGPFDSVSSFNDYLVEPVKNCPKPELSIKYREMLSDNYCSNFAHADLSYGNILVDESTGHVTCILDWEMAGFLPEWWEYRKALFGSLWQKWWVDLVKKILTPYEKELEAERCFGVFPKSKSSVGAKSILHDIPLSRPIMRSHGEERLPSPFLFWINLMDIIIADERGADF